MASRDPAYAIQKAVRAALIAHPDVITAFGGAPQVFDTVPVDSVGKVIAAFPYLTIGEDQVIGQTNQTFDISEIFVKVDVWSRATDYGEAKLLAGAVRTALDVLLDLEGHTVSTHTFHDAIYRREPDGLTRRAVITLRYQTTPAVNPPYLS